MSVVEAVTAELAAMPEEFGVSGVAAMALVLAESLDDPSTRPTARAIVARELRETLTLLRQQVPPKTEEDDIERARKRRAARLEGKPAAGSTSSS